MAQITMLKALSEFFNTGASRKPLKDFAAELKELSDSDKLELATLAAAEMGHTIKAPAAPKS